MIFEVISHDVNGAPVCCSCCSRAVDQVVVLPITERPELQARIESAEGEELWMGLCAYCVLDMAKSLQAKRRDAAP